MRISAALRRWDAIATGAQCSPEQAVESIREYAMKNGPTYMTPREIVVLDDLPKGTTGKMDRKAIKDAYSG